MSLIFKPDGWNGVVNDSPEVMSLYLTNTGGTAFTATAGDAVAVFASSTAATGGATGEAYRLADSANADAEDGTCAIVVDTVSVPAGGTWVPCYISGRVTANVDSGASVAIGDDLIVGSTAGRLVEYGDATTYNIRVVGKCLSTPASNLATIYLNKHPRFAR